MNYFMILDIGTTVVKAFAYDGDGRIIKKVEDKAPVLFPNPGWVEQDPVKLWNLVYNTATKIIDEFGNPLAIGISTQRASTIVWYKDSGEPLYNMITWQDSRAVDLAEEYSKKFVIKFGRSIGKFISLFVRRSRNARINYLLTLSGFKFGPNQPIIHLRWIFDNIEDAYSLAKEGKLFFGTLDTWIIYNLLRKHITDYTNASATGLFDPFFMKWSDRLTKLVRIPKKILPRLVDNMGRFGIVSDFGGAPLTAIIADQQASLYSAGSINPGTIKITNGTGTFIDVNVGHKPLPAQYGLYPLVAFKWRDIISFLLEGIIQASGSAVDWLIEVGLLRNYDEIGKELYEETDAIIFIPALAGIGAPYWLMNAKGLIYGLTRATKRMDIVNALLRGVAYRCAEVINILRKATGIVFKEIIADGNASRIDYLLKKIAEYSGVTVKVVENLEGTSRGAYLLTKGGFEDLDPRKAFQAPSISKVFQPDKEIKTIKRWDEFIKFIKSIAK